MSLTYSRKLAPPGDEPYARVRWTSSVTSYTQVTPGSTPTGGDPFPAVLFGVQEIVSIQFAGTVSGNFEVIPVRVSGASWILMWRALNSNTVGGEAQTTGTEAAAGTNLTGESVYLVVTTRTA